MSESQEGSNGRKKRIFIETLKSARIGVREAQYEVGLMFANGVGVRKDIPNALSWVRQAADRGLPAAQYLLATRYAIGLDISKDDHAALEWYLKAAGQGHVRATYKVGKHYETTHTESAKLFVGKAAELGLAEAQFAMGSDAAATDDSVNAAVWFEKAALQGLASAQAALGDLYANGRGVKRDLNEAKIWYRKAAKQLFPAAQVALERIDEADTGRSTRAGQGRTRGTERRRDAGAWISANETGDAETKYLLGLMFEHGLGVSADLGEAKNQYLQAARQASAKAQVALARIYEKFDIDAASAWYQSAADQGSVEAQFALGRLCSASEGDRQNYFMGVHWYMMAANQGDSRALMTLGNLFDGDLCHLSTYCHFQAAENGIMEAQYALAKRFSIGRDAPLDPMMAFQWYLCAAEQGHHEAQCEWVSVT